MTYSSFIKQYLGKSKDFDGVPSADPVQCVDLVKFYLRDVFGIKPGAWGNARDYYECFNSSSWGGYKQMRENFTRIANTPTFVPMKGDIAVWGAGLSKFGHIAIADGTGNTSTFYTHDQNWYGKPCKRVQHSYKGFLGVLRPKRTIRVDANIRKGPGIDFEILGEYKKGEKVTVYQQTANWCKVGDGKWVNANLITEL